MKNSQAQRSLVPSQHESRHKTSQKSRGKVGGEKKSNRVMPRARKFESRKKYYIDGKKEKNLAF